MSRFGSGVNREDVLHSNAIAKVAQGKNIGATNSQPFAVRQQAEKNRSSVNSYKYAAIHSDYRPVSPRPETKENRPAIIVPPRPVAAAPKSAQFSEPSSRGYNPFG